MAWQEFPLACAFLDHYPRSRTICDALAAEARGIVRALRNHPSLIAWCGGNEINPRRERLPLDAIERRCLRRKIRTAPGSRHRPRDGEVHQWQVWHGYAPWTELAGADVAVHERVRPAGAARRGDHAEMFPRAPADLAGRSALGRAQGAGRQAAPLRGPDAGPSTGSGPVLQRPSRRPSGSRRRPCRRASRRAGCAASRRQDRAGARPTARASCGGVAFWQLNEPWPAVSWSVIDRAGRPKAAYEMLRRSFSAGADRGALPGAVTRRARSGGPRSGWSTMGRRLEGCRAEALLDGPLVGG